MKRLLLLAAMLFAAQQSYAACSGMTTNINSIPASCFGQCNGAAQVFVTGGSGNYNYFYLDLSNNAVGTSNANQVTGLCAGNFKVVVQDITNSCFDTTNFSISQPPMLVSTAFITQGISCFGASTGVIQSAASGGTPPYMFMWSNGVTTPINPGVQAGAYILQVVDANGCQAMPFTVVMNQPTAISINTSSTPSSCSSPDGTATATAIGGTPTFVYSWNTMPVQTTATATGLAAGTYIVTATDANGCTATQNVTVSGSGSLVVTANATGSSCNPCTGQVFAIAANGTAPYEFSLDGGPQQSGTLFTNVCPGPHTVTAFDDAGCMAVYTVIVPNNGVPGLSVSEMMSPESGIGMQNGILDLTLTGGNGPFTFLWSNGATGEDIYSLTGGVYSVTITDVNGFCATYAFQVTTLTGYGWVTGTLINDANGNCVFDSGEFPLANYLITLTNGTQSYFGYTNSSGQYSIWAPTGNYTLQPSNTTNLSAACGSSINVAVPNGATAGNNNFYYQIPPVHDVCVNVWSSAMVPGFNGYYAVTVTNYGSLTSSGDVCLPLPAAINYLNSSITPNSTNGDTICFSYSNLNPGATFVVYVNFFTPIGTTLGSVTIACANATVTNGTDINPGCNTFCYTRVVTGSYDPNDKSVSPSGIGSNGDIEVSEDKFTYLIRFQNTGNGPAVNIFITDTLSSLLDPTSIVMLNASHDYSIDILPGNIIRWHFANIMLPDSTSDEPNSHGHVQFTINTMNTPQIGQSIENTANIYFDFNEPVITNTTINTYADFSSVTEHGTESILLYPNPAGDRFSIRTKDNNPVQAELIDISGRIIRTQQLRNGDSFQTADCANGVYLVRLTANDTQQTIRLVVQH
ncbi:MAG TPA: hypothetical protein DEP18_03875 [Flavobacteriales bacterium]|nr:hypothetical protein [Flavobacteriales bacterium]HCA82901.1 hypothetical protein [Flavobacteriales bacterium]HRE73704.1 T9SS type A sorting domain-containing protein [Flavobacteriales bacterium]HRE96372.1 T9SS type A sorting domain-containing protein [Flavobacteriales bacterium]HRJ34730.1 T9SS type A sorting domain-containing protein [Flavobacteriales bacterium]